MEKIKPLELGMTEFQFECKIVDSISKLNEIVDWINSHESTKIPVKVIKGEALPERGEDV